MFDVADSYGGPGGISELVLGEAIGNRRDSVVIATKAGLSTTDAARGMVGASRRYLMAAVDASLRRLKTDRIDLYQIHNPDPDTPIDETLRALEDMMHAGKILYYGASNLAAWQATDAAWTARDLGLAGYVSVQNEYNLLARGQEAELLPALDAAGLGLIPYFPLACGLLTGKYRAGAATPPESRLFTIPVLTERFLTERHIAAVERLSAFVEERGRTLVELAFSWLASRPQVSSIIASATSVEQLRQNVAAAGWVMTAEEIATAEALAAEP
jgi:aryl-alcohol dehydrogenase-like predicted oxidoreductase